jgi:hypothetical protein
MSWPIGQIAASHGWGLLDVNAAFAELAPTPKDLGGWAVDALSIACLLRCADAAQPDGRRARALQQAVQRPQGESADHWSFQRRLHPARRDGDRLVFESTRPFEPALTDAWWLAYEWLSMADGELRAVDALLAERRPNRRFAAGSVEGSDTSRFGRRLWTTAATAGPRLRSPGAGRTSRAARSDRVATSRQGQLPARERPGRRRGRAERLRRQRGLAPGIAWTFGSAAIVNDRDGDE